MKWRYQNLRIVLHRPVLLNIANRSSSSSTTNGVGGDRKPAYSPSSEELAAVETCRRIAKETIEDMFRDWSPNQMVGWNAVWFLYQASMIPLVSIFWEKWNTVQVLEWQKQIETVLGLFAAMADWSLAARRSLEVVSKMYEASKRPLGGGSRVAGGQVIERSPGGTVMKRELDDTRHDSVNGHTTGHGHGGGSIDFPMGEIEGLRDVMMSEMQEGMEFMDQDSVWDLDGMLWADGEMPYDGLSRNFYSGMDCQDQMGAGLVNMNGNVVGNGYGPSGGYMMH